MYLHKRGLLYKEAMELLVISSLQDSVLPALAVRHQKYHTVYGESIVIQLLLAASSIALTIGS